MLFWMKNLKLKATGMRDGKREHRYILYEWMNEWLILRCWIYKILHFSWVLCQQTINLCICILFWTYKALSTNDGGLYIYTNFINNNWIKQCSLKYAVTQFIHIDIPKKHILYRHPVYTLYIQYIQSNI